MRTLNQETSLLLSRVKAGEETTPTERGEVIARIVPAAMGPLQLLIDAGELLERPRDEDH